MKREFVSKAMAKYLRIILTVSSCFWLVAASPPAKTSATGPWLETWEWTKLAAQARLGALPAQSFTRGLAAAAFLAAETHELRPTHLADSSTVAGLTGRVTVNGIAVPNISLLLRMYDQTSESTIATTATDSSGNYRFANVPSLPAGKIYYVRFGPNTTDPTYINAWFGPDISAYMAGTELTAGDFDIANVAYLSPAAGASVGSPADFIWQKRTYPKDSYRWMLFDLSQQNPCQSNGCWFSSLLGYTNQYRLESLPTGVSPDKSYGWEIHIYDSTNTNSYGFAYYYRSATFIQSTVHLTHKIYLPLAFSDRTVSGPTESPATAYVNMYRAMAGLPAVTENATWNEGAWKHSRYLVKNNLITHSEDSGNPWYTPDGDQAGQNGNVAVNSDLYATDQTTIDQWMEGPFHALAIIDPALLRIGFGSFREANGGWQMAATMDILRGRGGIPPFVTFPVLWPSGVVPVPLRGYGGSEFPDPLSNCAGYTAPAGLPILLQLGTGSITPNVTSHSFKQGNTALDHCVFDETNYTNADNGLQGLGRGILNARDAVVLIPRAPLTPGSTYTVSIGANGQTYTWSFTVSPLASAP
ncbi:MAG: hypothetical protein EXR62_08090 [Chloroflexi bacterium]|nr:hypothetical protein [Chloroflexota bacterium]